MNLIHKRKYNGYFTISIDMVMIEITARGSSLTKYQNNKEYPILPKTELCASEIMERKEKASSLHSELSAGWRQQRSESNLPDCTGVGPRLCEQDINIYVFLNVLIFLLWLYNIPWWPDLAAECYTESWRDIKMKEKKNIHEKWWHCPLRERRGGVWWGNPVCCSLWDFSLLSLVPFFLNVTHAGQTHTVPPSHCHGNLLCWEGKKTFNRDAMTKSILYPRRILLYLC